MKKSMRLVVAVLLVAVLIVAGAGAVWAATGSGTVHGSISGQDTGSCHTGTYLQVSYGTLTVVQGDNCAIKLWTNDNGTDKDSLMVFYPGGGNTYNEVCFVRPQGAPAQITFNGVDASAYQKFGNNGVSYWCAQAWGAGVYEISPVLANPSTH